MSRSPFALALALLVAAPAAAQVGVYADDGPASLGEAQQRGQGLRISGRGRQRIIPEFHTVRRGDTLWDVTGRYYGTPWEWPRVWSFNPDITNPHWIYPLDRIRLLPPRAEPPAGATTDAVRVRPPVRRLEPGTVYLRQEGFLDSDALEASGVIVGSPDDHMLLAPYDRVYVQFEEGYEGTPRGEFTVYRPIGAGERTAGERGSLVRIFGTVRVDSYDPGRRQARATIIEALDPIERGFRVANVPRRFHLVPPRAATRNVASEVVASLRPRVVVGEQHLVFLPVGSEDGVQAGNRFFILRSGDRWRDSVPSQDPAPLGPVIPPPAEPSEYPSEVIAEGRVVEVQPHSAALFVTRATYEVRVGDRAEMRDGY